MQVNFLCGGGALIIWDTHGREVGALHVTEKVACLVIKSAGYVSAEYIKKRVILTSKRMNALSG